jgi:hypothetical protein
VELEANDQLPTSNILGGQVLLLELLASMGDEKNINC